MIASAYPHRCPCGRLGVRATPLGWAACCGRFLEQGETVPDAESLMRSRYSAHVRGREDWLRATWHPSTRPDRAIARTGAKWLGLEVRRHQMVDHDHAEVEFVARYRIEGRAVRQHERSRFVREAGQWLYLDGELL